MITASQSRNYVLCPRKVYLDIYGSKEKKIPPAEFMLKKAEEGREFELVVASKFKHKKPHYRIGDLKTGAKETLDIMQKGESLIYQGVISHNNLVGIPDFLEKEKGKSKFGDFHYTVSDIKTGLSVKKKYVVQVIFYAYLLSKIQGVLPKKVYLILGDESRHEINVEDHLDLFKENLDEIKEIVKGKEIQPSRVSECPNCRWHDVCFDILLKRKDLSLLYKLTKKDLNELKENNIKNLNDVTKINPEEFSQETEIPESRIKKWILQARSWTENKPILNGNISFPENETEIFLDFESEDSTHYLIGILARDKNKKETEKTMQFVAHKREDEKKAWKDFIDFIEKQNDFVIYHYGPYEKKVLKQLGERHGISKALEKKISDSLFDLLKVFHDKIMLPTWSYSLKPVAKYIGFKWRNSSSKGDISMLWYDSYIKTGDKKFINMIKEYNEDDVIATRAIKDWLYKLSKKSKH